MDMTQKINFWSEKVPNVKKRVAFNNDFINLRGLLVPRSLVLSFVPTFSEKKITVKFCGTISDTSFFYQDLTSPEFEEDVAKLKGFLQKKTKITQ